jgi:hypothetical protein
MLTALNSITSAQAKPTKETMASIKLFLDYAATYPHAVLTYHASDMVLVIHNWRHAVKLGVIFSCHWTQQIWPTMDLYSTLHNSSKPSCHWRQKQNLEHCTSMLVKQSPCKTCSKKWVIHNHQPQHKPTTVLHSGLSLPTFNQGKLRQWTWDSLGSKTAKHRNNSNFSGDPAKLTSATTGPNITALHITSRSGTAF